LVGIGKLKYSMFFWIVKLSAIAAYGKVGITGIGTSD
jgi:hypothetical protein